ncbi:hypothetical protein [uncultured Paludibaculum sp.]|uniref:hypothetical protein n=1 Tax=uncultured Paludibaculum sp. TaxID=1765020 RepID=UPI002AAB4523|nr:hypothetical protein [uncultured Paludibaculum sp.]
MYKSFSVWDRADGGLYRYCVLQDIRTLHYSVIRRDFFGEQQTPNDWHQYLDQLFVELLLDQSPEEGSGAFETVEAAIAAFDTPDD